MSRTSCGPEPQNWPNRWYVDVPDCCNVPQYQTVLTRCLHGESGQFGHPGQSYQSGHSLHDFTICVICTLHNFQFYLAHLWTDFQSSLSKRVTDKDFGYSNFTLQSMVAIKTLKHKAPTGKVFVIL